MTTGLIDGRTDRRRVLRAAAAASAGLALPGRVRAVGAPPAWTVGFADLEGDVATRGMRSVHGRMPAGLAGRLFRNGPAKFRRPGRAAQHWFDGDGLVRRFTLNPTGVTVAARFVDTPKRRAESAAGAMLVPGFGTPAAAGVALSSNDDASAANTSLMGAGGELWALWEAGSPVALDPDTLATRGFRSLGEGLAHMPFLAHPRAEPGGRTWNLGQSGRRAVVWRLDGAGRLEAATPVDLPRASYIHDFTATAGHLVLVLQPWIRARDAAPVLRSLEWRPELGTQVLVLDKDDLTRRRIFELPPLSFFHLGDAWEEGDGTIRFDMCAELDPTFGRVTASEVLRGEAAVAPTPLLLGVALHRDGRANLVRTGTSAEFPASDHRLAGARRRFTVHVGGYGRGPVGTTLGVYDWMADRPIGFDFGGGHLVEEFLFVPRDRDELDGWLVGTTINLNAGATELHVFDGRRVQSGPVGTWRADLMLPLGFHGVFLAS